MSGGAAVPARRLAGTGPVARPVLLLGGALLLAGLGAACSQAPEARLAEPEARLAEPAAPVEERTVPDGNRDAAVQEPAVDAPEEREPAAEPEPPPETAAAAETTPPAEPAAAGGSDRSRGAREIVTVTRPDPEPRGSALWEAAVEARRERGTARPPAAVITDENLHEFQGAELTFTGPRQGAGASEDGESGESGAAGEEAAGPGAAGAERGEEYWRSRVLDLRVRLRAAVDEVDDLQAEVAALRRAFYAEDDPYVRDGRIKPAWDRARDRLEETRQEIGRLRLDLDETLEEGRRAGAYPGWLREGIELEPRFEEEDRLERRGRGRGRGIDDPREPRTVEPVEPPEETDEPPR